MADEYKDPVPTTIKDLGEQLSAMKEDLNKLSGADKVAPAPADKDPVTEVKKEFSSIFKKLHDSLNGIQGVSPGGVTGVKSSESQEGTATIDNKGPKVKLDPETIEALTGDRKGFKGRKDRVKKTKRELLGLKELAHENAGAAAADALINKKKGVLGATGAAVKFTANKIKQALIEKFDPLRAINRATGGSKIATVLAGKAMFRSEKSIRAIAGMDRRMGLEGTRADRNSASGSGSPSPVSSGAGEQSQSPSPVSSGAEGQGDSSTPILVRIDKGVAQAGALLRLIAEKQGVGTQHLEALDKANEEMLKLEDQARDEAKAQAAGQEKETVIPKGPGGLEGLLKGFDLGKLFDKIFDMIINKGFSTILKTVMKWAPLIIVGLTAAWVAFTTDWKKMWHDLVVVWDMWVGDIGEWFKEMWTSIKTIWTDMTDPVVKVFQDLVGGITAKIQELWSLIKPFWDTITSTIKSVVDAVMGKVNSVLEFLGIKDKPAAEGSSPGIISGAIGGIKKFFGGGETPAVSASTPATVGAQRQEVPVSQTGQALQQAHDNREQAVSKGNSVAMNNINANKTTNVTNNNTSVAGQAANPRNTESSFMRAMHGSYAPS